MIAAVDVEIRRLLCRTLTRAIGAVLVGGLIATPLLVDWAFRERARIERDADIERCVQAQPPKVRDGVTMATIPVDVSPPAERERQCRAALPERSGEFRLAEIGEVLRPLGALLILTAFMLGASAIGADWHAGFVATLLTWESRRARVAMAKIVALGLVVMLGATAWQGALTALLSLVGEESRDWLGPALGLIVRVGAVAAGSSVLGFALALAGRGTAAALAAGAAYVLVLESVLSSYFKPLRPWLALNNAIVFVKGQFEGGPGGDVPGRTVAAAALILACYLGVVVAGALAVFQRRDVT